MLSIFGGSYFVLSCLCWQLASHMRHIFNGDSHEAQSSYLQAQEEWRTGVGLGMQNFKPTEMLSLCSPHSDRFTSSWAHCNSDKFMADPENLGDSNSGKYNSYHSKGDTQWCINIVLFDLSIISWMACGFLHKSSDSRLQTKYPEFRLTCLVLGKGFWEDVANIHVKLGKSKRKPFVCSLSLLSG